MVPINFTKKKIPDPVKAKEHYDLFLKNKDKNIYKASKTVKSSNNVNIKSVTVRHCKTDCNLIKFITQPNIITKELETVEKPEFLTLVTIEHPKTVTKLSKPINQLKIITQQPNKIRVYSESKTADLTLQLDLN